MCTPALEEERRARAHQPALSHDGNPVSQQVSLIPDMYTAYNTQ